jgi:SAM-dependent methyltransferase
MDTWHENDLFWKVMAAKLFDARRWAGTPAEVDQILERLAPAPGAAVLDMGCGPGRHSLELARRGFRVTGVDRTARYLAQARERAAAEGLAVEFVEEDMRRFERPGAFDAALSMYTTFGYFEEAAENEQVLANLYRALKGGGALLMELMGKEVLARIFEVRSWREQEGVMWLEERRIEKDWRWIENRWILIEGAERHEFQLSHWVYSAGELMGMLEAQGFGAVEVFGSLEGAPYDQNAQRLVVVTRK